MKTYTHPDSYKNFVSFTCKKLKTGKIIFRELSIFTITLILSTFSLSAQDVPVITSFSPASGIVGTSVTINGTAFSTIPSENIVFFGAVRATVSASSTTSLTTVVPAGATFQPITVNTGNLTAYSGKPFVVTFCSGSISTASFATKVDFSIGTGPYSVFPGDLDGDGKADLISTNNSDNTVSVLRNTSTTGNISFATKVDFATGSAPFAVSLSDIDGDGKQDMVVSNSSSNTISIIRNTSTAGAISFASKIDFATAANPRGLAINDLNADGKPDIAVSNNNSASILKNTSTPGNISFAAADDYPTGTGANNISLGDLDGDGKADLAVTNGPANNISIFRNTSSGGNISFGVKTDYSMISHPTCVVMGDLDADGRTDLTVADGFGGGISVLRNTSSAGSISFASRTDFTSGGGPYNVSVGDLNGDGRPDLITGNAYDYTVSVLENTSVTGNISFNTPIDFPSVSDPLSTGLADLDGDGKMDLITGNFTGGNVSVFRNLVTGTAATITSFTPTSGVTGATVTITGTHFTGTTAVSFGGIAASSFNVVSASSITAIVGTGVSGSVSVTTPCGTTSLAGFTFVPFPVSVISSLGTPGPITYGTLKLAADAINSGVHQGVISVRITGNTIETMPAVFNASGAGSANYTSVSLQPSGGGARLISGSMASSMIDLNGADNVTIDGLNTGGNSLTISNTSATAATSTIRYLQDATNNTIQNCNILGSGTSSNSGTILFSAGASSGNSNNTISGNNIGAAASNLPSNAIYSEGTVGNPNVNITISNNNIFNYTSKGVNVHSTGSSAWTISGNSFYKEAGVFDSFNSIAEVHAIRVLGGSGYTISNNYIGGEGRLLSGSAATYNTTGSFGYTGILLTTSSATPVSNIKGNSIAKIKMSTVSISPAFTSLFYGIETAGSGINVGGSLAGEGNIIGSNSVNGAIAVSTASSAVSKNTSVIYGIYFHSSGGLILNNQVASFDIDDTGSSPAVLNFRAIYVSIATPPSMVNNNIVGSVATAHSIRIMSTSTATAISLTGIYLGSTISSGLGEVNGNTIQNISNLNTLSSGSFTAINTQNGYVQSYRNNTIKNIYAAPNSSTNSLGYTGIISSTSLSPSTVFAGNIIDNINYQSSGSAARIRGMEISGSGTKTTSITGNTISNLISLSQKPAIANTDDPSVFTIVGIMFSTAGTPSVISNNNFYNFSSLTTANINTVIAALGIVSAGGGNIFGNKISGFTNSATGSATLPAIIGIKAFRGSFNVYNNSIKIGNASFSNSVNVYGILQNTAGTNWNYFHNSIAVSGNITTGAGGRSAAFIRTSEGGIVLKNNLFVNTRTGPGSHYAISNAVAAPATSWLASSSNYNNLYSSNTSTVAEWGIGISNSFSAFQTNSGGEANSVNRPVSFIVSDYDLQPDANLNCGINNIGVPVTTPVTISTDINAISRSASNPDLGAYEYDYNPPVHNASNNGPACVEGNVTLDVTTGAGVSPFTYSWTGPDSFASTSQNPVISNLTTLKAGVYTVAVTDLNGCTGNAETTVVLNASPAGTLSSNVGNTSGTGSPVIFTATDGISYNFKINGTSVQNSASSSYNTSSLANGQVVSVTVTGSNDCMATYPGITMSVSGIMVNGKTYMKWNGTKIKKWNGINKVN